MTLHRTYRDILEKLAALVTRRPRSRRTRLYCVGAPRTGTHSIAAMFDAAIRSGHEPAFRATTKKVLEHHRGDISFDELRSFVERRDRKLGLDVDSSHVNAFLIDAFLAEFEDARFLLTIRDCWSWTDSAINHSLNSSSWSQRDREYLEFYFDSANMRYSRYDECLKLRRLPSIDCYLATWSRHNNRVLSSIPPERLLVVRTGEISASLPQIAQFAGVAEAHIDPGRSARGTARARHGILGGIDPSYLEQRAAELCGPLMQRFFPGLRSLADALAVESAECRKAPSTH